MSGGETWPFNLVSMNGVPLDPTVTLENLEELKNWRVNPDDVYIASYPKSGTTWTLHIVQLIKANGIDHGVLIPWLEQAGAEICKVCRVRILSPCIHAAMHSIVTVVNVACH